ncbi:hypothetical protein BS78_06G231200 [Paspalum vaginatum]|nr:hypothetical protein BS78_06G231200 [Paspalum vaginatum]
MRAGRSEVDRGRRSAGRKEQESKGGLGSTSGSGHSASTKHVMVHGARPSRQQRTTHNQMEERVKGSTSGHSVTVSFSPPWLRVFSRQREQRAVFSHGKEGGT